MVITNLSLLERPIRPVREGLLTALIIFVTIFLGHYVIYQSTTNIQKSNISESIIRDARIIASSINWDAHTGFTNRSQETSEAYIEINNKLKDVLSTNLDIKYIYTTRMQAGKIYFVLAPTLDNEKNASHLMDEYKDASEALVSALSNHTETVSREPYTDKWGTFVSGYIPIYDSSKNFVGVLGIDLDISVYKQRLQKMQNALVWILVAGFIIAVLLGFGVWRIRLTATKTRKIRLALLEDIVKAREYAEAQSSAKSQFLANMSHELRTPMHAILSFSKFGLKDAASLKEKIGQDEKLEEIHTDFASINDNGQRLLILINDLLDLAKLEAGKVELHVEEHDITEMVNIVHGEINALLSDNQLQYVFIPPTHPIRAKYDLNKMCQVVRNILSNAIKFTPKGKVITVSCEAASIADKNSGKELPAFKITVTDQGLGIPEAELTSIFDKFIQSSKTRSGAGGTGLGLSICAEIIELHGGKIWAKNRVEGGAVFEFVLPII